MRPPHYLVISCGSSHIAAVHLSMNGSGRCELVDYWIKEVGLSLNEPLLWLKAASQSFPEIRSRFKDVGPVGYALPGNLILTKYLKVPQTPYKKRKKIVAFEARQNIPYPIGEVAWDDCLIDEDDLDIEMLIAASKTETDPDAHIAAVLDAQRKIYERGPAFLPIMSWTAFTLYHSFVKNVPQGLGGTGLYLWNEAWIDQGV